jgi:phosphoribosylformylglycinamidine cyclo-ligase
MSGQGGQKEGMTYEKAGVSISNADDTKKLMSKSLETSNPRVLNKFGAFGSLVDGVFTDCKHPVLVLKMEEPGSKQLLAAQHKRLAGVGYDLVNHLINDVVVMGARPIAVLDTIVCGALEKEVVVELVASVADACRAQDCDLVGGETSEQPRVLPAGSYILSAAALGVVDKEKIVDGSAIREGDVVLAVASNGLHTNGYTLVRSLLDAHPDLGSSEIAGGQTFLDAVLEPHTCYSKALQELFAQVRVTGLAHITGGGIAGNLVRVLPQGAHAEVDASRIKVLPVFKVIRDIGAISDEEMLRSLNCGVGLTAVVRAGDVEKTIAILEKYGHHTYPIGVIKAGKAEVSFAGRLSWRA